MTGRLRLNSALTTSNSTRDAGRRGVLGEVVRFGLVGLVNTGVSLLIYYLLTFVMPYPVAYTLGFAVGVLVSFFLNCHFTWRVRPTWRRFVLFPSTTVANFVISLGATTLLVEVGHWGKNWAALVATVLAVPVTFLLARYVLTGRHNEPGASARGREAAPVGEALLGEPERGRAGAGSVDATTTEGERHG